MHRCASAVSSCSFDYPGDTQYNGLRHTGYVGLTGTEERKVSWRAWLFGLKVREEDVVWGYVRVSSLFGAQNATSTPDL